MTTMNGGSDRIPDRVECGRNPARAGRKTWSPVWSISQSPTCSDSQQRRQQRRGGVVGITKAGPVLRLATVGAPSQPDVELICRGARVRSGPVCLVCVSGTGWCP